MATAVAAKTKLPPNEYDALKALVDRGGTSRKVTVADLDLDKKALNNLKLREGFLEVDTRPQGRGTEVTAAKVLINLADYERNANRAPRATGAPRAPRAQSDGRGVVQIPKAALPLDHAKVREYLDAVRGDAQREFERRKQDGLTDVEFAKATKGLKGTALRQKMRELDAQFDMDFETFIRGMFPSELVTILGIPEPGPDTAEQKPRR